MDKPYKIYAHINKINNKMYIGMTCRSVNLRSGLRGQNYRESPRFDNDIKEFGWENFDHVILRDGLTKEEAAEAEREFIKLYNTQDPDHGYNTVAGGFSLYGEENLFYGKQHNEKTKEAIRESNRRRVWTEEAKQRIRDKVSGDNYSRAVPIYCYENGQTYASIREAADALNIDCRRLSRITRGLMPSYKEYTFKRLDERWLNA